MPDHRWHELAPRFQLEWEARYGHTGIEWTEIWQAVRFGWEAGQRPEFRQRTFADVQEDLAGHWFAPELATEEMAWDYVREAVEMGYHHAQDEWRRTGEEMM